MFVPNHTPFVELQATIVMFSANSTCACLTNTPATPLGSIIFAINLTGQH